MAIKRTPADDAFSKCIRESVAYMCERCGSVHTPSSQGLHASHYHTRGNWSVRFDPDNVSAHCYGCHQHLGSHPAEFKVWMRNKLGEARFDWLELRSVDASLGRQARKEAKDIAKHYREQLKAMKERRRAGQMGVLQLVSWV